MLLAELLDELPEDLARQVFTHASWSERRGDSYTRLAFLGDSVLALAVTTHLYPRLLQISLPMSRPWTEALCSRRSTGIPDGRLQIGRLTFNRLRTARSIHRPAAIIPIPNRPRRHRGLKSPPWR